MTDRSEAGPTRKALPLLTPPSNPAQFCIRVNLEGAEPPLWRALTLPSDLTLDRLHEVLQSVFGWRCAKR